MPQGPILFNIYLNNLFYFLCCDVCNFVDDTTPYVWEKNLEENSNIVMKWFENNYMKMNSNKCHLFISGNKFEHLWAKIGNDRIWENETVELLGITIDNELKFDEHVNIVCLLANRKSSALSRIKKYLDFNKVRILFKAFFKSQFNTALSHGCFIVEVQTIE